jgi:hypothetical protein
VGKLRALETPDLEAAKTPAHCETTGFNRSKVNSIDCCESCLSAMTAKKETQVEMTCSSK